MEDTYLAPGPPNFAIRDVLVEGTSMQNVWDKTNGLKLIHTARKVLLVVGVSSYHDLINMHEHP